MTEAGWFVDPGDASRFRYWNGEMWTDHIAPRTSTPPPPGAKPPTSPRQILLYVGIGVAVLVGLVGMAALTRWSANHPTSDELRGGDCITDLPLISNFPVHKVSCTSSHAYRVIFNTTAHGGTYPGNSFELQTR